MDEPALHRFRSACLDWLEADDPSQVPVPSLEGLSPAEVARARSWLRSLAESRRLGALVLPDPE